MKAYILSVIAAAVLAAVAERICPRGEGERLSAHIRMVAGLFVLVTMLVPVREGVKLLLDAAEGDMASRVEALIPSGTPADYGEVFGESLTGLSQGELTAFVTAAMENEFGVPPTGCAVQVACGYGEGMVTVQEARISLLGQYALTDPHPIEAYFGELLGCPCYVTVGG